MSTRSCCKNAAGWIVPGVGLALIPKCPICVAGYVAALTGLGISIPMAGRLRWGLIVLCVVALVVVAARPAIRCVKLFASIRS